jgi:hypothetical protein
MSEHDMAERAKDNTRTHWLVEKGEPEAGEYSLV